MLGKTKIGKPVQKPVQKPAILTSEQRREYAKQFAEMQKRVSGKNQRLAQRAMLYYLAEPKIAIDQPRFLAKVSEFEKIFDNVQSQVKKQPIAPFLFIEDITRLSKLRHYDPLFKAKFEDENFLRAKRNPKDAYAIRLLEKGKLVAFFVFIGSEASEADMQELAKELLIGYRTHYVRAKERIVKARKRIFL